MTPFSRGAALAAIALCLTGAAPTWMTPVTTNGGGHRMGNPDARVKLISFESYTCHACADFEQKASQVLKLAYVQPGKVSLEVRPFIRNPVDLTATMLTKCVAPNKFFAAHRALFLGFDKWSPLLGTASKAQLDRWNATDRAAGRRAIASDLGFYGIFETQGLSRVQADRCLNDVALANRLAQQTKDDSEKYNLSGTPSFVLNGTPLLATHGWPMLQPQIDAQL